jgi:hypothetical protein
VSTQLRLVEGLPARKRAPRQATARVAKPGAGARRSARVVRWGDWHLDEKTRTVGRAGVAAARRALEDARAAQELRQAS